MRKLHKLTQAEDGRLFYKNFIQIRSEKRVGKIKTLTVQNPCINIETVIDEFAQRDSAFIPEDANSYVASDFNPDTQHLRKSNLEGERKFYSVFAVQFYNAFEYYFEE